MKIPQAIIDNYGLTYKPATGPKFTLLWNHSGVCAAERLGLNKDIGDATQLATLLYGMLLACQPDTTFGEACLILDGETYAGRAEELKKALIEARKKADPKWREAIEKIEAQADTESTKEDQDPNPQTASE